MFKSLIYLFALLITGLFVFCEKAEIEKAEVTAKIASSEKECVPDAGCAGCPEAYARVVRIPPKKLDDVLELKPKVILIELGSINFIPGQKMQIAMQQLKQKYGRQIQVIYYDVMKHDQRIYAEKYDIEVIPTQVFLDQNGDEIMRHEGLLPIEQIEKFLQDQGLKAEDIASR